MKFLYADGREHIDIAFSCGELAPFENLEAMRDAGWREILPGTVYQEGTGIGGVIEVTILTHAGVTPSKWLVDVEKLWLRHGVEIQYKECHAARSDDPRVVELMHGNSVLASGGTINGRVKHALQRAIAAVTRGQLDSIIHALHRASEVPKLWDVLHRAGGSEVAFSYQGVGITGKALDAGTDTIEIEFCSHGICVRKSMTHGEFIKRVASIGHGTMAVLAERQMKAEILHASKSKL